MLIVDHPKCHSIQAFIQLVNFLQTAGRGATGFPLQCLDIGKLFLDESS